MKSLLLLLIISPLFFYSNNSTAQNFVNGGNNLTATGRLGTISNQSLAFITNNTERGRVTNTGNWGFGTGSPSEKVHINSPSGKNAFRVQINGSTKLLVSSTGGLTVGSSSAAPGNGLYVLGNVGVGTNAPTSKLHVVNASGNGIYSSAKDYGVQAYATNTYGIAVYGSSNSYLGVYGIGPTYGTYGYSSAGQGATGYSYSGTGVYGYSSSGNAAKFESYSGTAMDVTATTGFYAAIFHGNTFTYGTNYTTSDRSLKRNIQDVGNAMSIINKLKPRNYDFRDDGKYASMNLPKGNHYGLIAQELEEVLPNLVTEVKSEIKIGKQPKLGVKPDVDGKFDVAGTRETTESVTLKGVNYIELIPIMVKAMQEQQATIDKQNAKIEELTQKISQLQNVSPEASVKLSGISLAQNAPNPVNHNSTRIRYNIPAGAVTAALVFTNAEGQKIREVKLDNSGLVNINTSSLTPGTYFYTLYVNGKSLDSKKMIITRY